MPIMEKITIWLSKILLWIATSAVVAIMVLAVGNILMRSVYRPFGPTYELISFLSAIAFAFTLGYSQFEKVHVKIEFLIEKLSNRMIKVIKSSTLFISFCFFSMVTWQLMLYAGRLKATGAESGVLKVPTSYLVYVLAFGFGVFTIVMLVDVARFLKEGHK